jgi:8-oxo-dGTP pyrophosphatase MutT (NUDIX family)
MRITTQHNPIGEMPVHEIKAALDAFQPDTTPSERALRHAAVALILRDRIEGGAEALFIKRSERDDDPWSGQMALPGGRRDPEDESLEHTARRETHEEVGLVLDPAQRFARLHDIDGGRLRTFELTVSPFLFHTESNHDFIYSDEVETAVWVPLSILSDTNAIRDYVFHLDPFERPFPSFHFDSYIIWGLTYRIIADFMAPFGVTLPREPGITDVE